MRARVDGTSGGPCRTGGWVDEDSTGVEGYVSVTAVPNMGQSSGYPPG